MSVKTVFLLLAIRIFFCSIAFAETIVLKSGQRLENVKILEKNQDSIKVYNYKINEDGADFGFIETYKTDEVQNIEPDRVNRNYSVVLSSIVLKSGKVVNVTIVDADQDSIKTEDTGGVLSTYSWNDIYTINSKKSNEIKNSLIPLK